MLVMEAAKMHGIPLVITLGGGYGDPIERTAEAHANTFRMAAEMYGGNYPEQPVNGCGRATIRFIGTSYRLEGSSEWFAERFCSSAGLAAGAFLRGPAVFFQICQGNANSRIVRSENAVFHFMDEHRIV